jgi:hypothetical protein
LFNGIINFKTSFNYLAAPMPDVSAFIIEAPVVSVIKVPALLPDAEESNFTEVESPTASVPPFPPHEEKTANEAINKIFFIVFCFIILVMKKTAPQAV